jgi:hypothetical protein
MNRMTIMIVAIVVVTGGVVAYQFASKDSGEQPPINANVAKAPSDFPPPLTTVARPTQPALTIPPPTLPAPIAKELAAARALAPKRPMTQLAKSWFGCASEDAYQATMTLIEQKSPSSTDHFNGPAADCASLPMGTHITLLHINSASGIAQISIDDTHQVYWTDTAALAGDPTQN